MPDSNTIEIIKLISTFLTPLVVLILGLSINRTLEKNKKTIAQEKEWQVRWSDTFLTRAIKTQDCISEICVAINQLQPYLKSQENSNKTNLDLYVKKINDSIAHLEFCCWDVMSFTRFAKNNGKEVNEIQDNILNELNSIIKRGNGNLQTVREFQYEYNSAIRKAHYEILNSKQ